VSDLYKKLQETADRLIQEFGTPQKAVLTRKQTSTHDPVLNGVIDMPSISTALSVVVLPVSSGSTSSDNLLDEDTVAHERQRFVIASTVGAGFEPKAKDQLTLVDEVWTVLGCTPIKPAETPLVYKLRVMK